MKCDMTLLYKSDTEVFINVIGNVYGVEIHTRDGSVANHFSISTEDVLELIKMLTKASEHSKELNK